MKTAPALAALTMLATTLAGTAIGTAPAASAEDPAPVTVTWPEVTQFNPTQTSYEFTVTNNGTGHLFYSFGYANEYVWEVPAQPLPGTDVTMDFTQWSQHQGVIKIWSCTGEDWADDGSCTEAARSPQLAEYSSFLLGDHQGTPMPRGAGPNQTKIYYAPQPPMVTEPTITWELLNTDKRPFVPAVTGVVSAAELDTSPDSDISKLPYTIPTGRPSGQYFLDVRMSADDPVFGHLEGSFGANDDLITVNLDSDAPVLNVRKTDPVIYPVSDGYHDGLTIRGTTNELTTGTFEVTNAAGQRVYRSTGHRMSDDINSNYYGAPSWSGRRDGKIVPEGRYHLEYTAADSAGNKSTWTGSVAVSHKSLQWTTFKRTVSAKDSLSAKPYVGACSTLASRPQGALGFYSQTRCKGSVERSAVISNHGMYIPKAYQNHYDWLQVTLNGGPDTGSSSNYMVLGYISPRTGKMIYESVLRGGNGAHPAQRMNVTDRVIFDRSTDKPFIIWSNGLTAGSRYNVRSYTVQVRYQALR